MFARIQMRARAQITRRQILIVISSPSRRPFKVEGVYRIMERPRVLAFTWLPSWDEEATETMVRFDLDEQNGVTTVRLTHSGFATEGSRGRHLGWPQILGWLKAYAEG